MLLFYISELTVKLLHSYIYNNGLADLHNIDRSSDRSLSIFCNNYGIVLEDISISRICSLLFSKQMSNLDNYPLSNNKSQIQENSFYMCLKHRHIG